MGEKKEKKRIRPVIEEVTSEEIKHPSAHAELEKEKSEEEGLMLEKDVLKEGEESKKDSLEPLVESKKRGFNIKLLFVLTILTALVVGFVAGGFYVYLTGARALKEKQNDPMPTPTPTFEPQPTPTPNSSPEPVDVTSFEVSVLNGSGRIGEAGRVRAVLEKAGFKVSNVGNASSYDFAKTQIQVKASISESVTQLLSDALTEADYEVQVGKNLASNASYDIIITVGEE